METEKGRYGSLASLLSADGAVSLSRYQSLKSTILLRALLSQQALLAGFIMELLIAKEKR